MDLNAASLHIRGYIDVCYAKRASVLHYFIGYSVDS